jgi:hypothetical protein
MPPIRNPDVECFDDVDPEIAVLVNPRLAAGYFLAYRDGELLSWGRMGVSTYPMAAVPEGTARGKTPSTRRPPMRQTARTDDDVFDRATRMLAAQAAAERMAVDHVRYLRRIGATLKDAAEAIGLDPANARNWDAVTLASHRSHGGPSSAPLPPDDRAPGLRCNGACQSAG